LRKKETNSVGLKILWLFTLHYKRNLVLSASLIFVVGLTDVIGVAALAPIFTILSNNQEQSIAFTQWINHFFDFFDSSPTITNLLLLLVAASVLKAILNIAAMAQVAHASTFVAADWRRNLLNQHLKAKWLYFSSLPTGRLTAAMSRETERLTGNYNSFARGLADFARLTIHLALAFILSWEVTLASILAGVITIFALSGLVTRTRRAGGNLTQTLSRFTALFVDSLTGIKAIKSMGQEAHLQQALESEIWNLRKHDRSLSILSAAMTSLQEPILIVSLASGLWIFIEYQGQQLEIILILALLFARIVQAFNGLQRCHQNITSRLPSFEFVHELMESAKSAEETFVGTTPFSFTKNINFNHVSFSYDKAPVISDLSLDIPAGNIVALVGPSGGGKTTISDLVLGLMAPDEGKISIDGVDLKELDIQDWRSNIGFVPQETFLFHDTILANVALGDKKISETVAINALERAGIWHEIEKLESGIYTIVGERGTRFSGGQRQRISIARALARHSKLLILDEATSALDPASEATICQTLKTLTPEVTILAISHQPAIAEISDIVYRLKDGRVEVT
jgi:ATP-binding cassette, subfamily C, bacterial